MITIGPHSGVTLTEAQREALLALPAATLSDVLGPGHVLRLPVAPLRPEWRAVGPALTVLLPPGDNLGMHVAVREARPGDLLLVQQGADSPGSPIGEIMALAAQAQGVSGIVIEGPVRDRLALRGGTLPVFATGACPQACSKGGPAWINVPLTIGGTRVRPGDIVVADDDGVVVVPHGQLDSAIAAAQARVRKERLRIEGIAQGQISPEWLDQAMHTASVVRL